MAFQNTDAIQAARSLLQVGRPDAALARLQQMAGGLTGGMARDPAVLDCAAMAYWQLGDGRTALALMQVLTDGWPRLLEGWSKRAAMAASTGQTALAEACLKRALGLAPKSVALLAALNRVAPFSGNSPRTHRLRKVLTGRLNAADRALACNALARIEDRAGRYRQAFHLFERAKAAGGGCAPAGPRRPTLGAPAVHPGPQVVFVVGMPRSGTSLMERILDRHPHVSSVGESKALSLTVDRVCNDGLTGDQAQAFYLEKLCLRPDQDGHVIVDKMPLNILDLDVARWCLPRARAIFMDRHPLDVGLSCFSTNFLEGNGFSHRLDWIGQQILQVQTAARRQEAEMGPAFRRQSYRSLVEAPEAEIRAVLAHLDLAFHVDCLSPQEAQTPGRTASLFQVNEAINHRGLDRWHRYEPYLAPLVQTLGQSRIADWESKDRARQSGV